MICCHPYACVCEMVILAFTWDLIESLLFAPLDLAEYKRHFQDQHYMYSAFQRAALSDSTLTKPIEPECRCTGGGRKCRSVGSESLKCVCFPGTVLCFCDCIYCSLVSPTYPYVGATWKILEGCVGKIAVFEKLHIDSLGWDLLHVLILNLFI